MSALLVDATVVASLVHADSVLGARVALGTLMFTLGRSLAVAEGRDADAAGIQALEQVRDVIGLAVAEAIAAANGIETEQAAIDRIERERERSFESDVPWGTP